MLLLFTYVVKVSPLLCFLVFEGVLGDGTRQMGLEW